MKLITFGDSWTEGVGGNLNEEYQTDSSEERTKIRQKYCWPRYLSDLLNINFINNGIGGTNNNTIFEAVFHSLKTNQIKKGDFVIVLWSSFLRDDVPFFSKGEWHFWGERYKRKKYLYDSIFTRSEGNNILFDKVNLAFKQFYIDKLYTDQYYNIVNQNYIIQLQYMFNELGIRYLFCDAFDLLIKPPIIKEIDKTHFIDTSHYWNFSKKTFKDFLIETNRKNVWEDNSLYSNETLGKHPNSIGYELIANEMFTFINDNNLLIYELKTQNSLLI